MPEPVKQFQGLSRSFEGHLRSFQGHFRSFYMIFQLMLGQTGIDKISSLNSQMYSKNNIVSEYICIFICINIFLNGILMIVHSHIFLGNNILYIFTKRFWTLYGHWHHKMVLCHLIWYLSEATSNIVHFRGVVFEIFGPLWRHQSPKNQ